MNWRTIGLSESTSSDDMEMEEGRGGSGTFRLFSVTRSSGNCSQSIFDTMTLLLFISHHPFVPCTTYLYYLRDSVSVLGTPRDGVLQIGKIICD